MQKWKICALTLGLGINTAYAGTMGVEIPPSFDGFYAGLGAGYSTLFSKFETVIPTTPTSGLTTQRTLRASDSAFLFNGQVGYGRSFLTNLYLGAKGSVYYTPVQQYINVAFSDTGGPVFVDGSNSSTVSVKPVYNIDGVLGFEMYPHLMPFVEAGVSFANVKTISASNLTTLVISAPVSANNQGVFQTTSGYKTGYNVGIGASYQVNPNWFVSTEAVYNYLGKYDTVFALSPNVITSQRTYQLLSLMANVSYLIPSL